MKRLLWTALVAGVSTASASLALRALRALWTRIADEPPPAMPGWAQLLVGTPVAARVGRALDGRPAKEPATQGG